MKNVKILFIASLLILITSCDSCKDNISINRTSVDVENNESIVSLGEKLELDIFGKDSEGIKSIQIQIPVLSIDLLIDDNEGDKKWEIKKRFLVEDVEEGTYGIVVTFTDMIGDEYVDLEEFTVE